jgi:hypothetical protein
MGDCISEMGQKHGRLGLSSFSTLPSTADIIFASDRVRKVPQPDSCIAAKSLSIRSPRRRGLGREPINLERAARTSALVPMTDSCRTWPYVRKVPQPAGAPVFNFGCPIADGSNRGWVEGSKPDSLLTPHRRKKAHPKQIGDCPNDILRSFGHFCIFGENLRNIGEIEDARQLGYLFCHC